MRTPLRILTTAITAFAVLTVPSAARAADPAYDVLVFSKTAGFRHDSIAVGTQAVRDLGAANNFTVTATEDAARFTAANLAGYEAVVFLNTTGDVLDAAQQSAFEGYIRAGGGYVGVHAAADTEYSWPFYGELVGAWFASHPAIQQATTRVENRAHPATAHLGASLARTDEWYNFQTNPRGSARVLATLDESSYGGGSMGADHPHVWCKTYQGGRSFYTGGGHTQASYAEPAFRQLLLGGLRYASGRAKADCRPENGYTTLYNGATTGWSQAGPGSFTNTDGTLTATGGMGMLWYSAKELRAYSLKLDWRLPGDDNSGVFVGFPASSDPNSAVGNGYEIQIDATDSPDRTTGSVYGFKAADIAARDAALNPPGEWNTFEILVEGERLQVFLNGVRINDFTNTDPVRSLQQGHVGIQNHGTGDDAQFRNIRLKELGGAADVTVQAENWSAASGVQTYPHTPAHNGMVLGYVDPGDWAAYNGVDLTGVNRVRLRVASPGATAGGGVQVRIGSPTGTLLGTATVGNTGGWESYQDVTANLSGVPAGVQNLYLVFTGGTFDVDDLTLVRGSPPGGGPGPIVGVGGKCVDVNAGATADGTKIQLWTCNGSAAQRWTVTGQALTAVGKCLDVAGGATAEGTKVQLWTCNGTGAQNWAVQADGTLRNPQSGRCLTAAGGATADGTQLVISTCAAAAGQRWTLP
ncbi:type 1 glutamine amidotransferase [Phytomonospora endophytica]|uniref:Type 1 glutamine amidotransferase n=1 Tax=Phytomonospora endophytica TaxID=714109 RepID=A0A841FM71_9ACTN|nr:type 1 glutamine amidotransferase [Phytomonospora endophytica]GIG66691.1 glycosyl hydrolase [Phytomonospora endophytica]